MGGATELQEEMKVTGRIGSNRTYIFLNRYLIETSYTRSASIKVHGRKDLNILEIQLEMIGVFRQISGCEDKRPVKSMWTTWHLPIPDEQENPLDKEAHDYVGKTEKESR